MPYIDKEKLAQDARKALIHERLDSATQVWTNALQAALRGNLAPKNLIRIAEYLDSVQNLLIEHGAKDLFQDKKEFAKLT
jgi:hypothetical protein